MSRRIPALLLFASTVLSTVCAAQTRPAATQPANAEAAGYLQQMITGGLGHEERFMDGLAGLSKLLKENKLSEKDLLQELLSAYEQAKRKEPLGADVFLAQMRGFFLISTPELVSALVPSLDAVDQHTRDTAWEVIEGGGAFLVGQMSEGDFEPLAFNALRPYLEKAEHEKSNPPYKLISYMYELNPDAAVLTMARAYSLARGEHNILKDDLRMIEHLLWQLGQKNPDLKQIIPDLLTRIDELSRDPRFYIRLRSIPLVNDHRVPEQYIRAARDELLRRLERDDDPYVSRFAKDTREATTRPAKP